MRNKLLILIAFTGLASSIANATEVCGQIWKINTCGINGCPLFSFTTSDGPNTRKVGIRAESPQVWHQVEKYANSEREVCIEGALAENGSFLISDLRAQ